MKLSRLRIRNFRCYKNEIAFDFDKMTAFVGKNDVGKSTVTDALDIFLNDGVPDKNDASKNGDAKDLRSSANSRIYPSVLSLMRISQRRSRLNTC